MTETDGDGDTTPAGSGGDYSGGTLNMFARTSAHSGAASGGGLSGGGGGRSTRQQQHNKEAQKRYRCGFTVPSGCPVADLACHSYRCQLVRLGGQDLGPCYRCQGLYDMKCPCNAVHMMAGGISFCAKLSCISTGGCIESCQGSAAACCRTHKLCAAAAAGLLPSCLPADLSRRCGWSADGAWTRADDASLHATPGNPGDANAGSASGSGRRPWSSRWARWGRSCGSWRRCATSCPSSRPPTSELWVRGTSGGCHSCSWRSLPPPAGGLRLQRKSESVGQARLLASLAAASV
jgi:hypothetical protein